MATVVVAVFLPFLCFDVVFSAVALSAAPSGLNSEFYNDVRQLLELNSVLYQKVCSNLMFYYLILNIWWRERALALNTCKLVEY